jgi:4-hydroxybenzoate polyprenyltransferase
MGLDIVSHTLMLGGLLPLAGYLVYAQDFSPAILFMAAAATLGSTYGQLYNQLRDYDSDRAAGIVNLTIRLGPTAAWVMMYLAIGLAALFALLALSELRFPSWIIPASVSCVLIGLVSSAFSHTDASGKPPLDVTGRLQNGFWVGFNLLMALLVLWAMGVL